MPFGIKRLALVACVLAIVSGACGSSPATKAPASPSIGLPSAPVSLSAGPVVPATPAPAATPVGLVDTTYNPTPAAATGGILTIAGWQWPTTLMPYWAKFLYDSQLSSAMFDGLVKVTSDMRYTPNLVLSVPTLANEGVVLKGSGMDVTWELKPGMQWSDGQPINCDDIRTTWQWMVDPANAFVGTTGWRDVTGVDGGSGTHCVMHFSSVYEAYLTLVDPLLPAHYLTSVSIAQSRSKLWPMANLSSGVYSGAYIPVSATPRSQITLKANPHYLSISGHNPYMDGVAVKFFGDARSMAAAYAGGGITLAQDLQQGDLAALAKVPSTDIVSKDSLTYEFLDFNDLRLSKNYGSDGAWLARAIRMSIDRQAIVAGPLQGAVSVTDDFVPKQAWFYSGGSASLGYDPKSAATLLANMGWTKGPDGYLVKNGHPLTLDLCTTPLQVRVDTLNLVATQLKQLGIKAAVHPTPASTLFGSWATTKADTTCSLYQGTFDVAEFKWVSPLDPAAACQTYVSAQTPEDSPGHVGQNFSRVQNPALDEACQTVSASVDLGKTAQAMATIQSIYRSDQNIFELPLYFHKDVWLVSGHLHNFSGGPTAYGGTWNIGDWWLG